MNRKSLYTRLWVGLIATILLGGLFLTPRQSQALDKNNLNRALLATAKLLIVDNDLNILGTCSGTYLGQGVIVTNFHCVGQTDLYGPDNSGLGLNNGDFYNSDGLVAVAPLKDPKQAPKPTYFAQYQAGTPDKDIAVLKIVSMIDENTQLPSQIPIVAEPITDSDKIETGDTDYTIGYPGAGGETITYSKGSISGFADLDGDGTADSFKTDAAINPGNSGGLAIDDNGDQIGIPAFSFTEGSGIGGIIMINVAVPYIQQVIDIGDSTPGPLPTGTVGPQPTAAPGTGPFGAITFGTEVQNGELVGTGTQFATNSKQVIGAWSYQGMKNGMKWGWVWQYNGQNVIDSRNTQTWSGAAKGVTGVQISNKKGLPDGDYNLLLYVNNQQVQQGSFVVGQGSGTPVAPATPETTPDAGGVVLQGQIVDANTEVGIPGAVMVILKPGTSVSDWDKSKGNDLAAAIGVADQDGFYITAPGLERGASYTVIIGAKGYTRRVFEDGLELTDSDPDVVDIDPLPLDKK